MLTISVSLETSSQNWDVGSHRLRRVILKMTISPETSSKKRDLEKITNFRRAWKMGVSPETSSKKWDVDRGVFLTIVLKMTFSLGTSSENEHQHGRPARPARQTRSHFARDILKKLACSQHRLDIVLEVFEDANWEPPRDPRMAPRAPWRLPKMTISLGTSSKKWNMR